MDSGVASPRVLVVDDDPDVLASLERGLRLSGFDVDDGRRRRRGAAQRHRDPARRDRAGHQHAGARRRQRGDRAARDGQRRAGVRAVGAQLGRRPGRRAWRRAPTTTWSSRSCWPSWWRGCRALLRRRGATATFSSETIPVGPLEVDIPGRRARVNGVDVDLTKREFDLLAVLAEHKTAVLSRAQLLELVWGYDFAADTNVVDVFIGYLRRKLEAGGAPRLLHTVRGVGSSSRTQ